MGKQYPAGTKVVAIKDLEIYDVGIIEEGTLGELVDSFDISTRGLAKIRWYGDVGKRVSRDYYWKHTLHWIINHE